ncbi:kynurenine/alpha-aminoadipate aminotransferase, mitochondrial [Procambarus clarkii]|uniref:kynurenine/alpha-aminoadipate aminotransferase, mitochondrial n=1 Tax=Procambarus clarkii TaxID=6728 RepID=UPI00374310C0
MELSRFFSDVGLRRKFTATEQLDNRKESNKKSRSIWLTGGMPNPTTFPILDATFTLRDGQILTINKDLMASALQYSASSGFPPLVKQLQEMSEELHHPPGGCERSVAVTLGSIHGLSMAFTQLLNPGDSVLLQEPCSIGVVNALNVIRARIIPVTTGDQGLEPSQLREALAKSASCPAKVIYLNPTANNPTGTTIDEASRREIYSIACEHDLIILEDDPYYFLHFCEKALPSFLELDIEGRVVRFDSFSKTVSAGLRIGYVTGPKPLIERIVMDVMSTVLHASVLPQVMLSEILRRWGLQGYLHHGREVRDLYRERRDIMQCAAERHLTGLCEWRLASGGMFFWIKVLGLEDSRALVEEKAARRGVVAVPGCCFMVKEKDPCSYLRVSYSVVTPDEMDKAFKLLAKAIREETMESENI